jgi:hypothetical protein
MECREENYRLVFFKGRDEILMQLYLYLKIFYLVLFFTILDLKFRALYMVGMHSSPGSKFLNKLAS